MREQILKMVSCIAPDCFTGLLFYHLRQLNKTFRVEHRVATSKGNIHIGIDYQSEQLLYFNGFTTIFVPRLRIMTTHAMVFAPRAI